MYVWCWFLNSDVRPSQVTSFTVISPQSRNEEQIPLFVKGGTLLPLAQPVEHINSDTVFDLTVYAFGLKPADFTLYEDDGVSDAFKTGEQNQVRLHWDERSHSVNRTGKYKGALRIRIADWKAVDGF